MKTFSESQLLSAALDDERLRKAFLAEFGDDWKSLLLELEIGLDHPRAQEALDFISQLVDECQEPIASLSAEQDLGRYEIGIFGFDQLCIVKAPEYDQVGPFLSHQDAIDFVHEVWGEFLVADSTEIFRFPESRSNESAKAAASIGPPKATPIRYRIDNLAYSKLGQDQYRRHRAKMLDHDELLTARELANTLTTPFSDVPAGILSEVNATGWDELISLVKSLSHSKQTAHSAAEKKRKESLIADVMKFISDFKAGRQDEDGQLLEAAARAWAWRGLDDVPISEDDPNYEDSMWAKSRSARPRYFEAMNIYAATMGSGEKSRLKK